MAYSVQEGYYTVGDLGTADEAWYMKYKWYLVGAAVLAAAGVGYYLMKKRSAETMYGLDDVDDIGNCGCSS